MSDSANIIAKPFKWVNRISRAIFRGAPNLITSSDLNRQIEALKKEVFLLRQGSRVIYSDLNIKNYSLVHMSIDASYVFAEGIMFELNLDNEQFELLTEADYNEHEMSIKKFYAEIRLYAKESVVSYDSPDNDEDMQISGAVFEDGTKLPAADHVVYSEPTVKCVKLSINSDPILDVNTKFEYRELDGKKYVCTLATIKMDMTELGSTYEGVDQIMNVKNLTIPYSLPENFMENYNIFSDLHYVTGSKDAFKHKTYYPHPGDPLNVAIQKVMDRLYTLEVRLYGRAKGMAIINCTSEESDKLKITNGAYFLMGPWCIFMGTINTSKIINPYVNLTFNMTGVIPRPNKVQRKCFIGVACNTSSVKDSGLDVFAEYPHKVSLEYVDDTDGQRWVLHALRNSIPGTSGAPVMDMDFTIIYPISLDNNKQWEKADSGISYPLDIDMA